MPLPAVAVALAPMVGNLISKVLKKVGKDKISEEDQMILELEFRKQAFEELKHQDSAFTDFIIQYEGEAKDQTPFIKNLRGAIRPVFTAIVVGTFIYLCLYIFHTDSDILMLLEGAPTAKGFVLKMLAYMAILVLSFWFGERALTRSGLPRYMAEVFKLKKSDGDE